MTITFSAPVDGFEASDIHAANGVVTSLYGSGNFYTATIEPSSPGVVSVSIPANAAGNNLASDVYTVNYEAPLRVLTAHKGGILASAYHPDGNRIVTASADDTALIWNVNEAAAAP